MSCQLCKWHRANGENAGLRRIDDGGKRLDAEHAKVGDGERAALCED